MVMESVKRIVGADTICLPQRIYFGEFSPAMSQSHGVTIFQRPNQRAGLRAQLSCRNCLHVASIGSALAISKYRDERAFSAWGHFYSILAAASCYFVSFCRAAARSLSFASSNLMRAGRAAAHFSVQRQTAFSQPSPVRPNSASAAQPKPLDCVGANMRDRLLD